MGYPVGYYAIINQGYSLAWPDDDGTLTIMRRMPKQLFTELRRQMRINDAAGIDRGSRDLPCVWLDPQTMRCKHYEYRPGICRDFEVGTRFCLDWRKTFSVGADLAKATA